MLLITRRTGESIIINGDIEIQIVQVRGGRVKLGFEYPEGNSVYRKELYVKIQEENIAASTGDSAKLGKLLASLPKQPQPQAHDEEPQKNANEKRKPTNTDSD